MKMDFIKEQTLFIWGNEKLWILPLPPDSVPYKRSFYFKTKFQPMIRIISVWSRGQRLMIEASSPCTNWVAKSVQREPRSSQSNHTVRTSLSSSFQNPQSAQSEICGLVIVSQVVYPSLNETMDTANARPICRDTWWSRWQLNITTITTAAEGWN